MRNLQEKVKKAFCYQKLFWPFTVWINCSSDLKIFANSRPSASNFKSFSRSREQFFLTVAQNNFGNKIPFLPHSFSYLVHKDIMEAYYNWNQTSKIKLHQKYYTGNKNGRIHHQKCKLAVPATCKRILSSVLYDSEPKIQYIGKHKKVTICIE